MEEKEDAHMENCKGDGLKRKMEQDEDSGESSDSSSSVDTDLRKRAKLNGQLESGDLIEIFHEGFKDWALYEGDGHVVHLDVPIKYVWKQPIFVNTRCNVLVKRDLLKDVVGSCSWQINNYLDYKYIPQPVERILSAAREKIGQVMAFSAWFNNCEHFVNSLRYGLVPRQQHYEDPKPGDIVHIADNYEQVLYQGENFVVHLDTKDPVMESLFPGDTATSSSTEPGRSRRVVVKRELLKDVLGNSPYWVNNFLDYDCHPWPVSKILRVAQEKIGEEMEYRHQFEKDEKFISYLRYGLAKNESFREAPRPGDIIDGCDTCSEWWGIYLGDGYVIHLEKIDEKSDTGCLCTKHVVVQLNILRDVLKLDLLKRVVNWDLVKDLVEWDSLKDVVEWSFLKDVVKWDRLRDVVKWDRLRHVVKWDHPRPVVKWDRLKDVVQWDLLMDVVKYDLLKNVVKCDLLKNAVKWDLFKDVVNWDELKREIAEFKYRINNHLDDQCPLRPVDMILSAAKEKVGEEIKCMTPSCVSESFVTSLRYGLFPLEKFHEEIKPGDIVEIFSTSRHLWAISVGDGHVIHLSPSGDKLVCLLSQCPAHRHKAVVKRKLLKDVAGDCSYWVNNLFDHKFPPLPVHEILRAAEERIGEEMESSDESKDSEHFVSSLRYCGAIREQVHDQPNPGDLIEIYNSGDRRWAICEEGGYVVHVDFIDSGRDQFVVKRALLKDVLAGSPYRINNYLDNKFPPRSLYNILSTSKGKVGKNYFRCDWRSKQEDFVTSLRYGVVPREPFRDKPRPEAVIEIFHLDEKHWALYEGDGYIIHLVRTSDKPTASSSYITAVVKRELLKDVVGDGHYEVNMQKRHGSGFSEQSDVICAAKEKVGMEMEFLEWSNASENFVVFMKFGIISHEPFCDDPTCGDIIEIREGPHHHWAIYEHAGYVIHLAPPDVNAEAGTYSWAPYQTPRAVVAREFLPNVVWKGSYRVRNHLDKKYSVRPVNTMFTVAMRMMGMEVEHRAGGCSAKNFVTYLRYGVCYDEEFYEEPNIGDLIECFLFSDQWAIYEGGGYIIHLAAISDPASIRQRRVVKREPLKEVAGTCGYRVNNYLDYKYTPQPVSRILSAAQEKVGEEMEPHYIDRSRRFFTKLRYGDIPN